MPAQTKINRYNNGVAPTVAGYAVTTGSPRTGFTVQPPSPIRFGSTRGDPSVNKGAPSRLSTPLSPKIRPSLPYRLAVLLFCCSLPLLTVTGCGPGLHDSLLPSEVSIFRHHYQEYMNSLKEFTQRLYAKNPRYEMDPARRASKIGQIFSETPSCEDRYLATPSHELLALSFADDYDGDRVFVLGYGLVKSVREVYGEVDKAGFMIGLQLSADRMQKLHHNISQANWRMKVSRDAHGEPLFRANEQGEDGYLNMGYEVLITSILTRIEDDMHLRGGLPQRYGVSASTFFFSLLL